MTFSVYFDLVNQDFLATSSVGVSNIGNGICNCYGKADLSVSKYSIQKGTFPTLVRVLFAVLD